MDDIASSRAARGAIKKIPAEILTECLRLLPIHVAKTARLVCRRWSDTIARWLFQRVYFRPHPGIMVIFEQITSNPLYAAGVTELVYDANMFMGDRPCALIKNENSRLLHEQRDTLDRAIDLQHLIKGLQELPNLKSVRVLQDFTSGGMCIETGKRDSFKRYNNCYRKLWKTLDERLDPSTPITIYGGIQPWDARGVEHLFQALAMRSPQLIHFSCGSHYWGLPLKLLDAGITSTLFQHLARSLTCINIVDQQPESATGPEDFQYFQNIAKGIKNAQKLKFLSLTLMSRPRMDWETVFSDALWPDLNSLFLWNWHFRTESLRALCYNHKDTLQQLSLDIVDLKSSHTKMPWEDVCQELGQFLRLHYVRIRLPYENSGELSSPRVNGLLRQIMRWVPEGIIDEKPCNIMRFRKSSLPTHLPGPSDTVCGCYR